MGDRAVGHAYTLVLDAGTSRARCFVFDSEGSVASSRSRNWNYVESGEAYSLAREWQPDALWREICALICECMAAGEICAKDIGAVAVTSQRQSLVFLDADGSALYAGPNLDLRAFFEGAEIDDRCRERVYKVTGHLPSFMFAPAKIKWFQRHRPEVFKRITSVLTLADWLVFRLTGEAANERALAGEAGLLDIHSRDRCGDFLAELGIEIDGAPLVDAGSLVGCVSATGARETMLGEGTAVVAAGPDTQCALLGMGVSGKAEVGIVAGWSAPVQMITDSPLFSDDASTWAGCFFTPEKWVAESSTGDVGNAYDWLAGLLYGEAKERFAAMDALVGEVVPGSEGTQAILGSARTKFSRPGMRTGGFNFPVPLTLSGRGRGHFARAALESVAYGMKANLDYLESLAGHSAVSVALGGGMTRTRTFAPIVADVLGREILVAPSPDSSAVGAWMCAATATGRFQHLDEAADWARERMRSVEPDAYTSAEYQEYYRHWLELSERLDGINL